MQNLAPHFFVNLAPQNPKIGSYFLYVLKTELQVLINTIQRHLKIKNCTFLWLKYEKWLGFEPGTPLRDLSTKIENHKAEFTKGRNFKRLLKAHRAENQKYGRKMGTGGPLLVVRSLRSTCTNFLCHIFSIRQ